MARPRNESSSAVLDAPDALDTRAPFVGASVLYVLPHWSGRGGSVRPAVITSVDTAKGTVRLCVFAEFGDYRSLPLSMGGCVFDRALLSIAASFDADGKLMNSWHWPE